MFCSGETRGVIWVYRSFYFSCCFSADFVLRNKGNNLLKQSHFTLFFLKNYKLKNVWLQNTNPVILFGFPFCDVSCLVGMVPRFAFSKRYGMWSFCSHFSQSRYIAEKIENPTSAISDPFRLLLLEVVRGFLIFLPLINQFFHFGDAWRLGFRGLFHSTVLHLRRPELLRPRDVRRQGCRHPDLPDREVIPSLATPFNWQTIHNPSGCEIQHHLQAPLATNLPHQKNWDFCRARSAVCFAWVCSELR